MIIKEPDNATELRDYLLTAGREVIENVLNRAKGKHTTLPVDQKCEDQIWQAIIPILWDVDDIPVLTGIDEGTLTERNNCILSHVAKGEITIEQAQLLVSMLKVNEH